MQWKCSKYCCDGKIVARRNETAALHFKLHSIQINGHCSNKLIWKCVVTFFSPHLHSISYVAIATTMSLSVVCGFVHNFILFSFSLQCSSDRTKCNYNRTIVDKLDRLNEQQPITDRRKAQNHIMPLLYAWSDL